jgi:hypothetical protein
VWSPAPTPGALPGPGRSPYARREAGVNFEVVAGGRNTGAGGRVCADNGQAGLQCPARTRTGAAGGHGSVYLFQYRCSLFGTHAPFSVHPVTRPGSAIRASCIRASPSHASPPTPPSRRRIQRLAEPGLEVVGDVGLATVGRGGRVPVGGDAAPTVRAHERLDGRSGSTGGGGATSGRGHPTRSKNRTRPQGSSRMRNPSS